MVSVWVVQARAGPVVAPVLQCGLSGYQLQWREGQLIHLGTALVSARLAVLPEAAVHQGCALFAQSVHGKGWAGAVAQ